MKDTVSAIIGVFPVHVRRIQDLGYIRFYRESKLDSNSAPRARDGNRVNDFATLLGNLPLALRAAGDATSAPHDGSQGTTRVALSAPPSDADASSWAPTAVALDAVPLSHHALVQPAPVTTHCQSPRTS